MTVNGGVGSLARRALGAPVRAARSLRVPRRTILELDLEEGLIEHLPEDPAAALLARRQLLVRDVVEALHRAANDERVVALIARIGAGAMGLAQVEEVREAVRLFRRSGKPAVVFSETFGEGTPGHAGYYLATAFDEIYLQPSGDVSLTGLLAPAPFARRMLDKLGVTPRMDHRYEYKNALNLFTEEELTEPHREALEAVIESLFTHIVEGVARARGMTPAWARETIGRGPFYGAEAVEARLVDGLVYRDELYDHLKARFPGASFLYLDTYLKRAGRPYAQGETIALIYGVGGVARGESKFSPLTRGTTMGARSVSAAFRKAIADRSVRAILFRVDSPGGSYVASDTIWRETVRARQAGKPVIVSMGNVAGSGGYFVAMSADRIVAQPSTITGSIGVLSGKMLTRELWEKLGITFDEVEEGGHATMWTSLRDYSPEEWQRLQDALDRIYEDFTARVAEGRGMTREQVHEIARGRIWSGTDARRLGLVDELGGMSTALRLAREVAGIAPDADVHLKVYAEEKPFLKRLLGMRPESSEPAAASVLATSLLDAAEPLLREARRAGLLGHPGVLSMPDIGLL
ncbi:MAG: signal peptide peptidase SppA [Longimicrobiaceae bacterium]